MKKVFDAIIETIGAFLTIAFVAVLSSMAVIVILPIGAIICAITCGDPLLDCYIELLEVYVNAMYKELHK